MFYVYKIVNKVNNKFYIGKTTQTLLERFSNHLSEARRWQSCLDSNTSFGYNSKLYPAMNKYGYDNFYIELIEEVDSLDLLNCREKYWISRLNSQELGYNIASGGDGGFFLGCHHSISARTKISTALRNRVCKVETRNKLSKAKQNKSLTAETKNKISKAKLGKKLNRINKILCIETGITYLNVASAAEQTKISRTAISNCLTGRSKSAGGYTWKYLK